MSGALAALEAELTGCRRCPRLVAWREQVAREKRAAFRDEEYWGRPVPGLGDPEDLRDLEPVIDRLLSGLLIAD